MEVDARETGQDLQQSVHVGLAGKELEIGFLIDVASDRTPSHDGILTGSAVDARLLSINDARVKKINI